MLVAHCITGIAPQDCIYKHEYTRTYMYRQTERHSGWISEIVAAHTLAHVVHTRTPLRCGWAAVVTLIRSRSSYNHTYKHAYLCVYVYIYMFFFVCVFFWLYLTAGCLTLWFSSIQVDWIVQQPVVGPATRRFCRAFIASVSVCVSRGCLQSAVVECKCWMCVSVCTYEGIWQLFDLTWNAFCTWKGLFSFLFSFLLVKTQSDLCVTTVYDRIWFLFVHFFEHTRPWHTCRDHSHTLVLRWWRVWRWFALAPHTVIHTNMHTFVWMCGCIDILGCLSLVNLTVSLPNSLFLLSLSRSQLSALPPGFSAGFSSLQWVCVFLVAVYRVLCLRECVECVWVCVRMSVSDSYLT